MTSEDDVFSEENIYKSVSEHIFKKVQNYKEICELFLRLNVFPETQRKLHSILYDGEYNHYHIGYDSGPYNVYYDALARLSWAFLLIKNPTTFQTLFDDNIELFHGTNSSILPSILKYGLISHKRADEIGIDITTGEEFSRRNRKRDFISFTDVLDVAETYALINTTDEDKLLSFPIVIGIKYNGDATFNYYSDVREFDMKKDIPTEQIDVLLVPSDKIEIVRKMVNNLKIKVLPLDDIQKKFYTMTTNMLGFILDYDMDRFNTINNSSDYSKKFDIDDVKSFVLSFLGTDQHLKKDKKSSSTDIDTGIGSDPLAALFFDIR